MALAGLMISTGAMAYEPVVLNDPARGLQWQILSDRVRSNGDYKDAWFKVVVINDLKKDGLGVGDFSLYKVNFDCRSENFKFLKIYKYKEYPNRGFVMVDEYEGPLDYQETIPGTVGEALLNYVCKNY